MLVQGICKQKPANCLSADPIGLCTQCISSDYKITQGLCVLISKCKPSQYLLNGQCVDAPANCLVFNPSSGVCLTCLDGTSANKGLCCPIGQTVYGGQCVTLASAVALLTAAQSSTTPICVAFHPTTGYCLQCNGQYKVNVQTMTTC